MGNGSQFFGEDEKVGYLLKKYVVIGVKVSSKRKKSIKNFIFFLTFIINFYLRTKQKSSRIGFKLKDFNLRLLKIFFFNKILTRFALFYGKFLRHVLYILTNINKYSFKFCFITNNSVNAKFLVRYIGLKLKRKFPLFSVINPLKKELKKLSFKKRQKKAKTLSYLFNHKVSDKVDQNTYKESFKNVLLYLNNKYIELSMLFYKKCLTFITFDIFINFMWLGGKNGKDVRVSKSLKKILFILNEKKFLKRKKNFAINFK